MKVGIYSPYLDILGGGERYALTVAEFFLHRKDKVDLFWGKAVNFQQIEQRFSIDIAGAGVVPLKKLNTYSYDLIFWVSDGSIPLSFAKKNILHFQHPFNFERKNLANKTKLLKINKIVCNSNFTKRFIDKSYGVNSDVLYPPVDVAQFHPGKKDKLILSVGRFFSPNNPKNHEILIEEYKKMSKKIPSWKLVLLGGIAAEHKKTLTSLQNQAKGYDIKIITDVTIKVLKDYYSSAQIYWHAAGFGYDLEKDPEKAEHFGITTVESMSAGCVPIVFGGGGQLEIISENKNGLFWQTLDELGEKTLEVINSSMLKGTLSENAIKRSKDFSKKVFTTNLDNLLRELR